MMARRVVVPLDEGVPDLASFGGPGEAADVGFDAEVPHFGTASSSAFTKLNYGAAFESEAEALKLLPPCGPGQTISIGSSRCVLASCADVEAPPFAKTSFGCAMLAAEAPVFGDARHDSKYSDEARALEMSPVIKRLQRLTQQSMDMFQDRLVSDISQLLMETLKENDELRFQLRNAAAKGLLDNYPLIDSSPVSSTSEAGFGVAQPLLSAGEVARLKDVLQRQKDAEHDQVYSVHQMGPTHLCTDTADQLMERWADACDGDTHAEKEKRLQNCDSDEEEHCQVPHGKQAEGKVDCLACGGSGCGLCKATSGCLACGGDGCGLCKAKSEGCLACGHEGCGICKAVLQDEGDEQDSDTSEMDAKHSSRKAFRARISTSFMNTEWFETEKPLEKFVKSWKFDSIFAIFIVANCATMGMQAHYEVVMLNTHVNPYPKEFPTMFNVCEHVFTVAFSIECLFRLKVDGCAGFSPCKAETRSNFLDLCLVLVTGIMMTWLMPLYAAIVKTNAEEGPFNMLLILRVTRIARLVRVFHRVPLFREAWMLIQGLSDSSRTLFWTVVVIFFVTYVFAILGLFVVVEPLLKIRDVTENPDDLTEIDGLVAMLAGIDTLMYTLVQVLTEDSFHAFMREMLHYLPYSWLYWYTYLALACVVLMNLVTAVIVEHAMTTSQNDQSHALAEKERKAAKEMKELEHLFKLMDSDGSGSLSWEEFEESFRDEALNKKWMLLDFHENDCKELFLLLDDGDGEIETGEFFEGLKRMKGGASSKDVFRVQKSLNKLQEIVEEMSGGKSGKQSKAPSGNDNESHRSSAVLSEL